MLLDVLLEVELVEKDVEVDEVLIELLVDEVDVVRLTVVEVLVD